MLQPERSRAAAARKTSPRNGALLVLVLAVALLESGCGVPFSTLYGPAPLLAGTRAAGLGVGPIFVADGLEMDLDLVVLGMYASRRVGLSDRLEVGGSAGILNGLAVDAKYVLVERPFFVSANAAVSTDVAGEAMGFHPALLLGSERVYGGAKLMALRNAYSGPLQVLFVGGSFGGARRVVPEMAFLRDARDGEKLWMAGVKLQKRDRQQSFF